MRGKIVLRCKETRSSNQITGRVRLTNVSPGDKYVLITSLVEQLGLTPRDLMEIASSWEGGASCEI